MKVESMEDGFRIFVQNNYFDKIDWDNKDKISEQVKNVFFMIKKNYHISIKGLYRVKVYPNKLGVLIIAIKLDNESYGSSEFDLRIIVFFDKEIYLKFDDCYLLDKLPYFYKDGYFVNINNIGDIINIVEFGEICLGE